MKKQLIWGLCLVGIASPVSAAFFQQSNKDKEKAPESPVQVNVQGADDALAENIKALLPSLRNLDCNSPADRVSRFIESAQSKLDDSAQGMGYYDAHFKVSPTRQSNCLALNIAVTPGEPVKVTKINVQVTGEGKNLEDFQKAAAEPPYQVGDVLVHKNYDDYKTRLQRTANSLGFFDAEYVKREIRVDPDLHQAEIDLHFDTGKRFMVGKVNVTQDVLDPKHLNRFLRVREGEPYDVATVLKQQRLLEGSGYYKDVIVHSRYQEATHGQVPVEIEAIRAKRYTYTGKVGYGSDTGPRVEANMDIHWVNSKGHQAATKLKWGQKAKSVEATYKIPLWKPEYEYASASAGWQESTNDDIKSQGYKLGFDYNRRNKADWQQTAYINYIDEKTQVTGQPETKSQLTLLGGRLKKTEADDLLFPKHGWQAMLEVQGAQKGVLSDQSVLQVKTQGKYLHTFDNNHKIIARGLVGTTFTNKLNEMPKSLRYFAGGQDSVRGYDFESLGPTNSDGKVIGGKHVVVASAEYERPIKDKWSGAAFVDTGNAFDNGGNLNLKTGVGVGVRYKSPLGPIRADLAVPKGNTNDLHFYLSLGPDL